MLMNLQAWQMLLQNNNRKNQILNEKNQYQNGSGKKNQQQDLTVTGHSMEIPVTTIVVNKTDKTKPLTVVTDKINVKKEQELDVGGDEKVNRKIGKITSDKGSTVIITGRASGKTNIRNVVASGDMVIGGLILLL
jgi:hypothetical protein